MKRDKKTASGSTTEIRHKACPSHKLHCHVLMAVSVCAGVLFLLACPISFDYESLSILQDTTSPLIAFTTPQENSAFESTVTLTGTIVDYDNEGTSRSGASFIVSSSYSIDGDDSITGELTLTDEGGFSFSIPTASYRAQITVVVTAVDRNGNTGSGSITLVPDAAGPFLARW